MVRGDNLFQQQSGSMSSRNDSCVASMQVASQRRRNIALAVMSPVAGALLFGVQRSQPEDPLALLREMEASSTPIEVPLFDYTPAFSLQNTTLNPDIMRYCILHNRAIFRHHTTYSVLPHTCTAFGH